VTLTVNQAVPVLSWSPSGLIAVGMGLGSSQLDATATAPGGTTKLAGSFLYTPAAGATLTSPGSQMLSVTFTPSDTEDYVTAGASVTITVLPFCVAAWGDSLTYGTQGLMDRGAYPSDLRNSIVLPVQNLGVGGQTSTQIGVREGAIATYVTVDGGSIPATGGVSIIFNTGYEPINSQGPTGGVSGTILGIHGSVTIAAGIYTFTRTTPGSSVSAPGTPQFVVDTPYVSYLPIFWEGRNNFAAESQVLSDIAAQVETVPSWQNYLVLSVINMNTASEWIGGSQYKQIVALNNQLANIYGSHYLDIRQVLISDYDSTQATDVTDYNHDVIPTSLRTISGSGSLGASIGPTDTSFTVNMTTGSLGLAAILTIDTGANAENVRVTAVTGSTATVARDFGGLNTSHAAGAPVTETSTLHLNAKGYQIVANAVAQYLSTYEISQQ
jgi:hypothetical protein